MSAASRFFPRRAFDVCVFMVLVGRVWDVGKDFTIYSLRKSDFGSEPLPTFTQFKPKSGWGKDKVDVALQNMCKLFAFSRSHVKSGVNDLLSSLGLTDRDYVPREDHQQLLEEALRLTFVVLRGLVTGTAASRIISGLRGSGKSFVLKVAALCATLCTADFSDNSPRWRPGTVFGGYVPQPRAGQRVYYPTDMVARLLEMHSITPGWSPRNNAKNMRLWLKRENIRIFLVVDEFEHVYKGSTMEATEFNEQCTEICSTSSNMVLWLSGSGGRVRLMAKCAAPLDQTAFPGYSKQDKYNGGKWRYSIIRARLSVPQCMQLLVYSAPFVERTDSSIRSLVAACYCHLEHHNLIPADRFHPLELSEEERAAAKQMNDLQLMEKVVEMYWNSCGVGRAMEHMSSLGETHHSIAALQTVMASLDKAGNDDAVRKAQFLHALAELTVERHPTVVDPSAAFCVQGNLEFTFFEVKQQMGDMFSSEGVVHVTPNDCAMWADDEYLTVKVLNSNTTVGFAHPRYASVAIDQRSESLGGLAFPQRFSLVFPLGLLGQAYPEEMALESMATSGLASALTQLMTPEGFSLGVFEGNMPTMFEFMAGCRPVPGKTRSSWADIRSRLERLWSDPANRTGIFFMVGQGMRGVDGIGLFVRVDPDTQRRWLLIAYVQTKLAMLRDADFHRRRDHPRINVPAVASGLHLAHLDWCETLCNELNVSTENVVPVFVLQTCKQVPDRETAESLLASSTRVPMTAAPDVREENAAAGAGTNAPPHTHTYNTRRNPGTRDALKRCIEEDNAQEARRDADVAAAAAEARINETGREICGCSCVMDQARMYGHWNKDVTAYSKIAGFWPEYVVVPGPQDKSFRQVSADERANAMVDPWANLATAIGGETESGDTTSSSSSSSAAAAAASEPQPVQQRGASIFAISTDTTPRGASAQAEPNPDSHVETGAGGMAMSESSGNGSDDEEPQPKRFRKH